MYHDTIHINFKNYNWSDISFDYSFLISKNPNLSFAPINYGELLSKFNDIGFNLKYLKFNDIEEDEIVYCTYNYQPNFNIFFSAYKKLLQNKNFNINFEYGVIINGIFIPNNMNTFSRIAFIDTSIGNNIFKDREIENVIKGKKYVKILEFYQIVNKDGYVIANETTDVEKDFEQHFFERYDVRLAQRKYKLSRLKMQSEED